MQLISRKTFFTLIAFAIAGVLLIGAFVWSGIYNVGADEVHTRPVYALLVAIRNQSIASRARNLDVPNLADADLIKQGAGNYDAMCTGCHLAPGMHETELSRGLYPPPPDFSKTAVGNPAHHFWVIKHGVKATGMAAWGKSMDDRSIWGIVAFLQQLPELSNAKYGSLVASSSGHSHGGGEDESAEHDDDHQHHDDHDH